MAAPMTGGGGAVARLLGAPGPRLGQAMADALPGVRVLERDLGEGGPAAPPTRAVALPNGARVAAEDSRSPLVSAGVFAAGGAALGGPGAAVFEGLAFRSGTQSRCGAAALAPSPASPPPPPAPRAPIRPPCRAGRSRVGPPTRIGILEARRSKGSVGEPPFLDRRRLPA